MNKLCGFGCQMHHLVYCFIMAYGTERTLILISEGWSYHKGGFEEVFEPLSDTCLLSNEDRILMKDWPGDSEDTLVLELPIIEYLISKPEYLPPAIPKDLADRIILIHGDPPVWWISQFIKFIFRPQNTTLQLLQEMKIPNFSDSPIVGVHIRRTDKLEKEAAFHGVYEYMKYVKEYFDQIEISRGSIITQKRVYVASDDPAVFLECRNSYPEYTFLGDQSRAHSASVRSRYNIKSLQGHISDVYMLSMSDYIVCTFSSQVCRLAYEIQQQRYVDGSSRFRSLDDIWYFGNSDHQQEVIITHHASDVSELALNVGDIVSVAGNHWNGFSKGRNLENQLNGLYPLYKTKEKFKIVVFPRKSI